jgi:hypothetical protein
LTNESFVEEFKKQKDLVVSVRSAKEAAVYIKKHVGHGDTVLFKGKEAGRVLQLIV